MYELEWKICEQVIYASKGCINQLFMTLKNTICLQRLNGK